MNIIKQDIYDILMERDLGIEEYDMEAVKSVVDYFDNSPVEYSYVTIPYPDMTAGYAVFYYIEDGHLDRVTFEFKF